MFSLIISAFRKRYSKDRVYYQMLDKIFGITPNNIELYKLALIHRSASLFTDDNTPLNNERLEYLGDSILQAIVTDYLYIEFADANEGFMTQLRSKIVSRSSLNSLCISLGLDEYIITGGSNLKNNKHIFGDMVEAIIGAIYLDKGYEYTNRLIINFIINDKLNITDIKDTETDYKSRLIEWCQKNKMEISFETESNHPNTQNQKFIAKVLINGIEVAYGEGSTKKEAQQNAAQNVAQSKTAKDYDTLLEHADRSVDNN